MKNPAGEETETFLYFDKKTGLLEGTKTSFEMQPGQTMDSITTMSDYKEN